MNVQGAIELGLGKLGFKPIKENYPKILVMYLVDEPFLLESIQCIIMLYDEQDILQPGHFINCNERRNRQACKSIFAPSI